MARNRKTKRRRPELVEMVFRSWGGKRKGAGRKRIRSPGDAHRRRPRLSRRHPVHVTLRLVEGLPSLHSHKCRDVVPEALHAALDRFGMSVVHYTIRGNHLHLIIEAEDEKALSRGMQGLTIRIARGLNRVLGRTGKVFAGRYHARVLKTPREVRNVLCYVLLNHRRHVAQSGGRLEKPSVSVHSSWLAFDGWARPPPEPAGDNGPPPVSKPRTWLLTVGWQRHGLIDPSEVPGPDG